MDMAHVSRTLSLAHIVNSLLFARTMETFIQSQFQPTEACGICTEAWGYQHHPVALKCRHILGHQCLLQWLRGGRRNNLSCPFCRDTIYEEETAPVPFETTSIWNALCAQQDSKLTELVQKIWKCLKTLRSEHPNRKYTVMQLLNGAVFPALIQTANRQHNTFEDSYSIIAVTYASLGHPNTPQGLAMPLIRLVRLMEQAWFSIQPSLTTVPRTNSLFWHANKCIGLHGDGIHWSFLNEACELEHERYFPLLHLYTVLVSQVVTYHPSAEQWPDLRNERMNLVVARCCNEVGEQWTGQPSNDLKNKLLVVFQELRRHQSEEIRRISLRGNEGEEHIVRGLWWTAGWKTKRNVCGRQVLAS
jgi:hypothetical protein